MGEYLFFDDRFSCVACIRRPRRFCCFADVSVGSFPGWFDGERRFVLAFRRYRLDIFVPSALLILNS